MGHAALDGLVDHRLQVSRRRGHAFAQHDRGARRIAAVEIQILRPDIAMRQADERELVQHLDERLQHAAQQGLFPERLDAGVGGRKQARAARPLQYHRGPPAALRRPIHHVPAEQPHRAVVIDAPDGTQRIQPQRQRGMGQDRVYDPLRIPQLGRGEGLRRPVVEVRQRPLALDLEPVAQHDRSAGIGGHARSHGLALRSNVPRIRSTSGAGKRKLPKPPAGPVRRRRDRAP